MKLITKEIERAFEKQGHTGGMNPDDIKIICKLFYPAGRATWYLYERETEDLFWCFTILNEPELAECGLVSLKELKEFRGAFNIGIERDYHFKPFSCSLTKVRTVIKNGGYI